MTKIKKGKQGLYIQVKGLICVPLPPNEVYACVINGEEVIRHGGTIFREGDEVKTSVSGHYCTVKIGQKGTKTYTKERWIAVGNVSTFKRIKR